MSNTFRLIQLYVKNNVLPLSVLKKSNYPLYRYAVNNYRLFLSALKSHNVSVLNDLKPIKGEQQLNCYLKYFYGEAVNLSVLYINDPGIYKKLAAEGKAEDKLHEMGFEVTYNRKRSMPFILSELNRIADGNNYIMSISDPLLYSKLDYRAKKENMTLREYLKSLGFSYKELDVQKFRVLKDLGYSMIEISKSLNIPPSTLYRKLKEHTDYDMEEST